MNNRITPFVKRMRTKGGTIYAFSSAVEDIGLNINERNNIVKISNFALLNIPSIDNPSTPEENRFNVRAIAGAFKYEQDSLSTKDGRVLIAESFQNYALNLENNLLNRADYNAGISRTVSERVFWKWLKETGAVRWTIDTSSGGIQYWTEELEADGTPGYSPVVKYVGQVSAGNVRTDSFGTYNETYILIPTSHGQTNAYFRTVDDDNYRHGLEIGGLGVRILGRESYTLPHPDGLSYEAYYDFIDSSTSIGTYGTFFDPSTGSFQPGWWYNAQGIEPSNSNSYLTDTNNYLTSGIYHTDLKYDDGSKDITFRRSKLDAVTLELDIERLKDVFGDSELTYDKMATQYSIDDDFEFNTALIYYTVYNSTMDQVLARNLLGVLFLDAPAGNTANIGFEGILLPSLEKLQSGPTGFGTSYSLRLNIKTDNMVDDTQAIIVDFATSGQLYTEDWSEAFANLNTAVKLLTQNVGTINFISEQYTDLKNIQNNILNSVTSIENQVNQISRDIDGEPNTIAMFSGLEDPLIESSIYMRFGNIGIRNNNPQYPLHISGDTKTDDIFIENAIRDTDGNILLGYGSPMQLGSSTNYRQMDFYTGGPNPVFSIDTSGNTTFRGSVTFDESLTSAEFDFTKRYLVPAEDIGAGLNWDGTTLVVTAVPIDSSVEPAGPQGAIQFNDSSTFSGVASLKWSPPNFLVIDGGIKLEDGGPFSRIYQETAELIIENEANSIRMNDTDIDIKIDGETNISLGHEGGGGILYINHGSSESERVKITNDRVQLSGSTGEQIRFTLAETDVSAGTIEAKGDIIAFVSSFSDIRLKDDIQPLENPLDKILSISGKTYRRKSNGDLHVGLIAQEVESVIPEVVKEVPLPLETGDEKTLYKIIRYNEIIPYLIESIKEQQKSIDQLKSEIDFLKKQI